MPKKFINSESLIIDNYLRTLADADIRPRKKLLELKRFIELTLKQSNHLNQNDDISPNSTCNKPDN